MLRKKQPDQMLIDPILANIGLPMVAVYLPFAWFALLPTILIEAGYGTRHYHLSFRRALLAQAIANGFSTVIGIPMTWFAIVLVQVAIAPGGIGPAWLAPDPSWWSIAVAVAVLTVVFYFMSVAVEGFVVKRFFCELPRHTIRRWIIQSNGITYALLLALLCAGLLAPKVSAPMVNLMQPVNDGIVDGVFWVIDQVSGKQKSEPLLIQAVEAGNLKKAQKLISNGANVNQTDHVGFLALSVAAGRRDEKMTKLLLETGADVNARSAALHDTALARAAQNSNGETVRVLLAAGAHVDDRDGAGWTPLFKAALKGDLEIVEALLSAGADVNARSSSGWTALKEAQMRGHEAVVQRLKSAGAIDFPDGSR
jgi:hypothetical protein